MVDTCGYDDVALNQITKLVGMSRMALEEAEGYFDQMIDEAKRAEAKRLMEDV